MQKLALITFLSLTLSFAQAQFWHIDGELQFYPQDAQGNLIKNLRVTVNGKAMHFCDSCRNFVNRQCYAVRMPLDKPMPRVKITIEHPDYLPYDDSVSTAARIFLFKPTDTTYVYKRVKVPMRKTGLFISAFRTERERSNGIQTLKRLGGTPVKQRAMCHFFNEEHGPFAVEYTLPPDVASADSLVLAMSRVSDTGPLYESDNAFASSGYGLANYFTIEYRPQRKEEADSIVEQLKLKHNIAFSTNQYNSFIITVPKGKEHLMVPMIEEMLHTEIFIEPQMEFYQYECPG